MSRKKSTLISLGISTALLAIGIWYLFNYFRLFPNNGEYGWFAGHHMGMGGSMGGFMMIFWVLVLGAIVLLISGAFTRGTSSNEVQNQASSAIDILKRRYAKGEIDKTEFEEKLKDIQR